MFNNIGNFIDLYNAIISAITGEHQGFFKSKVEEGPVAESPRATKLSPDKIIAAFAQHGNDQKSSYSSVYGSVLHQAGKRSPKDNAKKEPRDRKTAFSPNWLLPLKSPIKPEINSESDSLGPQSKANEELTPNNAQREQPESTGLPNIGMLGSVAFEEREPSMQNLNSGASKKTVGKSAFDLNGPKAQPNKPWTFDEFVFKFLGFLDNPGIIFASSFWNEAIKEEKKEIHTKEDNNNEPLKIREYADIKTIERFQTKVASIFGQGTNTSEASKEERPPSEIKIISSMRLQGAVTEVATTDLTPRRG